MRLIAHRVKDGTSTDGVLDPAERLAKETEEFHPGKSCLRWKPMPQWRIHIMEYHKGRYEAPRRVQL